MTVSPSTQAVLLLTAHLSKTSGDSTKPLMPREWGRFAVWLKEHSLRPEQLVKSHPSDLLGGWSDRQIPIERIEALLNRGPLLALAMEKWLRAGLWVLTRSDADYPSRLKKRLGTVSPAVFFGCGNRSLLNSGGLAVIGSRKAVQEDLQYSRRLGATAAGQGYAIVSGGARGVDEAVMSGALESEGTVVGVLADSLLRACSSLKYRRHLMANNLVLVSTFHPEAGFNVGNAMRRNKYIYCLSDAALVVHSATKGGTWTGATENLKRRWVPLWVKLTKDRTAGNLELVKQGARWATDTAEEVVVGEMLKNSTEPRTTPAALSSAKERPESIALPMEEVATHTNYGPPASNASEATLAVEKMDLSGTGDGADASQTVTEAASDEREQVIQGEPVAHSEINTCTSITTMSFYEFFAQKLSEVCRTSPKTPGELAEIFDLNKTQTNAWLKRAVGEKKVKKLSKPVRYQWIDSQQTPLFDG